MSLLSKISKMNYSMIPLTNITCNIYTYDNSIEFNKIIAYLKNVESLSTIKRHPSK